MRYPKRTIKQLKRLVSKRTHPGIDRFMANQSIYLTKLFTYLPLKPIQVMWLWFFLQIGACLLALRGGYIAVLLSIFLYQFFALIDNVDGQLARILGQESVYALWLDQMFHWVNHPLHLFTLSYAVGSPKLGILLVCLFYINRLILFNPTLYNVPKIDNLKGVAKSRLVERWSVYELFKFNYLFNALFIGALFNVLYYVLVLYVFLFMAEMYRKVSLTVRSLKEVDRQ